jgi:uncharacterized protein YprB with RNaseH-like and TPR domain
MFDLENLYNSPGDNELCEGCSILKKSKPCHSIMDYEELPQSEVLFLSDSIKYKYGEAQPYSPMEYKTIEDATSVSFVCAASVKCPSVREADMFPADMKICRQHLEETIDKVKPKLVFPCGNLAMKMLIKKSGITSKRGKAYEFTSNSGHSCIVVPISHPYSVIKEPRHSYLFQADIKNAIEKYVLGKTGGGDFTYETLTEIKDVEVLGEMLKGTEKTIAVDIETTGLNFRKDSVQTISISSEDKTWVIPLDHKDSPHKDSVYVWNQLKQILENPKNKKVFHNAKFDLKFLLNHGIDPKNVWDTKIMHHLINENLPKSLMDLVKLYFPQELESL